MKPQVLPNNPNFSSGPCAKRPGYDINNLNISTLGRSHRSSVGKAALSEAIQQTKSILGIPDDYRVGIVPASDTGAMEMVMWSMLGQRAIDVFHWESFGAGWLNDIVKQLKLSDVNTYSAEYGQLPDLSQANPENDVLFTWNGTTSGVKVPNGDWISESRTGLTICDATSAVFAMEMPWEKLDVTTFSWQKVLGGEGAHGVIVLSPNAIKRLESYQPPWPLPKIFRMTQSGKVIEGLFSGATINTPSMLCVADYLDALGWVSDIGGVGAAIEKSQANLAVLTRFVASRSWVHFLAQEDSQRSNTSVCFTLDASEAQTKALVALLDKEGAGYDIGAYKDAPSGLRIWAGATVESQDLEALLPWLDWAYQQVTQ
ncbi:phosphoserine transaminase [Vibrio methylphosphonaticus]|uniref:phosphoserine transaminase n=1 Tax=Vibrio methylphosphonaticus TaxID=2946866 RepID=UPI00202A209C|nr:phosphoserine transaminase [Vibrio methylphosphonaticus]MCL9777161.1 phosphoserine transaminase [Vibrio methylphosphonaticus]